MSETFPRMCDTTQTLGRSSFAFFSRSSMSRMKPGVQFTYTGSAFACTIALGTAANVKTFVSTLSPGSTPMHLSMRKMPEPQEFRDTQYLWPVYAASSDSIFETSLVSAESQL